MQFSFNFRDAPWDEVLTKIAKETGLSLQMDVVPPGTLNYYDPAVYTPIEALDVLNGALLQKGFTVVQHDRSLIVLNISDKTKVPLRLIPQVTARDLWKRGRNELLSVAFEVRSVPAAVAAKEVERLLGPLGSVVALATSNRLVVTDLGENLRRIDQLLGYGPGDFGHDPSKVIQLRNAPAVEVAQAISEFLVDKTQLSPAAGGAAPQLPSTVINASIVPVPSCNSIVLRASPRYMSQIEDLIYQLDHPPAQVIIQALLVEVELGNTDEFGVEFGFQDSVLFDRSVINNILTVTETFSTPGTGIQTTQDTIISQSANPGFLFNNKQLGNNTAINPAKVGSQGLSTFNLGRVNGELGFGGLVLSTGSESVSVLLRALSAKFKIDVLSRPQIRTVDNVPAYIQIGQQVPVVDGVIINAVGSANPVIRQEDAGIILNVTPRISPDGLVQIDVVAEKSKFDTTPGSGVPIFIDATNGNVIEAPIKDLITAKTTVGVRTGQTIVLGGMITKDTARIERKVPWLGDIPYLGAAFRYDFHQTQRKELLIFLTPHIILDEAHSERITCKETSRLHIHSSEATKIHGPILGWCEPNDGWYLDNHGCCLKEGLFEEDSYYGHTFVMPVARGPSARRSSIRDRH